MKCKQSGFTLIEIMIVVVIIGLLTSIIGPNVVKALMTGKDTRIKSDFSAIESAIKMYKLENYRYPDTEQGLEVLIARGPHQQDQGFLPKLPRDPWGRPYLYQSPGEDYPYEIYSLGADGLSGGNDENKDVYHWME